MILTEEQRGTAAFDLEKARAEVATASARRFSESREQARIFCAEEILPDALDEIERLRAALDESERILAHKTKTATHWYEEGLKTRADLVQSKRVVEQQAARIKELEDVHKRSGVKYAKIINELRSSVYANIPGLKKQWDEILNAPANGKIGPDVNEKQSDELVAAYREMRDLARCAPGSAMHRKAIERYDALRAEGKIGPDAKPRSWQITEDRVTAIDQGLRFLEWSNAKTGNVETKKRIVILKTMLEEASDEHGFER
jgi:hypothetical protein